MGGVDPVPGQAMRIVLPRWEEGLLTEIAVAVCQEVSAVLGIPAEAVESLGATRVGGGVAITCCLLGPGSGHEAVAAGQLAVHAARRAKERPRPNELLPGAEVQLVVPPKGQASPRRQDLSPVPLQLAWMKKQETVAISEQIDSAVKRFAPLPRPSVAANSSYGVTEHIGMPNACKPLRVFRLVLPTPRFRRYNQDLEKFVSDVRWEVAEVIGQPRAAVRVVNSKTLDGGVPSVMVEFKLAGAAFGLDTVAAEQLAAHVAHLRRDSDSLLVDAELQLASADPRDWVPPVPEVRRHKDLLQAAPKHRFPESDPAKEVDSGVGELLATAQKLKRTSWLRRPEKEPDPVVDSFRQRRVLAKAQIVAGCRLYVARWTVLRTQRLQRIFMKAVLRIQKFWRKQLDAWRLAGRQKLWQALATNEKSRVEVETRQIWREEQKKRADMEWQKCEDAATFIQAVWRGFMARDRVRERFEFLVWQRRERAATQIQTACRIHRIRRYLVRLVVREEAAREIQIWWRHCLRRWQWQRLKEDVVWQRDEMELYHGGVVEVMAATVIQSHWRAFLARERAFVLQERREVRRWKEEQQRQRAAELIQAVWRPYRSSMKATAKDEQQTIVPLRRRGNPLAVEKVEEQWLAMMDRAATRLQASWRGADARREVQALRSELVRQQQTMELATGNIQRQQQQIEQVVSRMENAASSIAVEWRRRLSHAQVYREEPRRREAALQMSQVQIQSPTGAITTINAYGVGAAQAAASAAASAAVSPSPLATLTNRRAKAGGSDSDSEQDKQEKMQRLKKQGEEDVERARRQAKAEHQEEMHRLRREAEDERQRDLRRAEEERQNELERERRRAEKAEEEMRRAKHLVEEERLNRDREEKKRVESEKRVQELERQQAEVALKMERDAQEQRERERKAEFEEQERLRIQQIEEDSRERERRHAEEKRQVELEKERMRLESERNLQIEVERTKERERMKMMEIEREAEQRRLKDAHEDQRRREQEESVRSEQLQKMAEFERQAKEAASASERKEFQNELASMQAQQREFETRMQRDKEQSEAERRRAEAESRLKLKELEEKARVEAEQIRTKARDEEAKLQKEFEETERRRLSEKRRSMANAEELRRIEEEERVEELQKQAREAEELRQRERERLQELQNEHNEAELRRTREQAETERRLQEENQVKVFEMQKQMLEAQEKQREFEERRRKELEEAYEQKLDKLNTQLADAREQRVVGLQERLERELEEARRHRAELDEKERQRQIAETERQRLYFEEKQRLENQEREQKEAAEKDRIESERRLVELQKLEAEIREREEREEQERHRQAEEALRLQQERLAEEKRRKEREDEQRLAEAQRKWEEEERERMTAEEARKARRTLKFDATRASEFVIVQGPSARHEGTSSETLHGVVYADKSLPEVELGRYFEIIVYEAIEGNLDGLVLGVTTVLPDAGEDPLELADLVPSSWSFGYDGRAKVINEQGEEENEVALAWKPCDLQVGDRVGLLVTKTGEPWIFLNERPIASTGVILPVSQALYPFVDLLGNTKAVSLVPCAELPAGIDPNYFGGGKVTFDRNLVSSYVAISPDGTSARHMDPFSDVMWGVVYTKLPIPSFASGAYFEVEVLEIRPHQTDGLVVGVTRELPYPSSEPYQCANKVPHSWSMGYDGRGQIAGENQMISISWTSLYLEVGDRIGALVTHDGRFWVFQNGDAKCCLPALLPVSTPLYGIVDLLGSATAVSILPEATPPEGLEHLRPAALSSSIQTSATNLPLVFDSSLASSLVLVSSNGFFAEHMDSTGEHLHAVLFSSTSIPSFKEGKYFEVRIEAVRKKQEDGLVLGVTTDLPHPSENPAESADSVSHSWSLGYDGRAHIDGSDDLTRISWNGLHLQVGDYVGLLITNQGEAWLLENGRPMVCLPGKIPPDAPLFAIVDLLGSTSAVSLSPGLPPDGIIDMIAQVKVELETEEEASSGVLSGFIFDRRRASKFMNISSDGMTATHKDANGDDLFGVVFTRAPLPSFDEGLYFEVIITATRVEQEDGLAIGVTTELPDLDEDLDETAESVQNSWSIGYDGRARVEGLEEMIDVDWCGSDLIEGDRIGLLILHSGQAWVLVNDKPKIAIPEKVPTGRPLYGLVDLIGMTMGVTISPGFSPPLGIHRKLKNSDAR